MDNQFVARVLAEIADLLEIKGENPFKIRAYRNGGRHRGDVRRAGRHASTTVGLSRLPGIGKDLAAADPRDLTRPAPPRFTRSCCRNFPPTLLDMLRLQGVGPKTAALLYSALRHRDRSTSSRTRRAAGRLRS